MSNPAQFVQSRFAEYYRAHKLSVPEVEKREFGFGDWETKIATRHLAFRTDQELNTNLASQAPFYVSFSAAYYEHPDGRPMPRKVWKGADLVFDLDVHHKEWDPESKVAPDCGDFTCKHCLEHVREQTVRLVDDFLIPEFGFSPTDLSINFSGGRGYHVHARTPEVRPLGRDERREVTDYLTATGLSFDALFFEESVGFERPDGTASRAKRLRGPTTEDGGWGGKIARTVCTTRNPELLPRQLKKPEKQAWFAEGVAKGIWDNIKIPKRTEVWRELITDKYALHLSDRTDQNVTIDVSKLIRLPDSLHAGSGLIAKTIQASALATFNPYHDALAFSNRAMRVRTLKPSPEVEFANQTFKALPANYVLDLPEHYAIYLMGKRAAEPA